MNRLERLFILLPWMHSHNGSTISEIAEHFQISQEQVVQDILLLSVTGSGQFYGEQFAVDWDEDRIYVDDTLGLDRPVKFDTTEAATLLLGLEALRTVPGTDDAAISSTISKLSSVLPLQSHLHIMESSMHSADRASINEALESRQQISFKYWNTGRDDRTQRQVSPLRVYFKDGVTFLDGFCHTSDGWRTFRLDRMGDVVVLAEKSAESSETFAPMELMQVNVSVDVAHESLLEDFPVVEKAHKGDVVEATIKVFGSHLLTRQILRSGGHLRVLSPESVQKDVQNGVLSALKAYEAK